MPRPRRGEILLDDKPIHKVPADDIVKKRIAMVPEGRQLFGRMSVWDNLLLGAYALDSGQATTESLRTSFGCFPGSPNVRDSALKP